MNDVFINYDKNIIHSFIIRKWLTNVS